MTLETKWINHCRYVKGTSPFDITVTSGRLRRHRNQSHTCAPCVFEELNKIKNCKTDRDKEVYVYTDASHTHTHTHFKTHNHCFQLRYHQSLRTSSPCWPTWARVTSHRPQTAKIPVANSFFETNSVTAWHVKNEQRVGEKHLKQIWLRWQISGRLVGQHLASPRWEGDHW